MVPPVSGASCSSFLLDTAEVEFVPCPIDDPLAINADAPEVVGNLAVQRANLLVR
jgi:hypothetical protein